MYKFTQKLFVFLFVLTSAFVLTSVFNSKEVCAGWTCCTPRACAPGESCTPYPPASDDCGKGLAANCTNGCCDYELKNPGSEGANSSNSCPSGTVSNSCSGGGGILCTAAVSPNPINLAVNETKQISVNVKAYSTKLGFVRFLMGNTATAIFTGTTSPTNGSVAVNRVKWNTCCGFAQTTKTFTAYVKGVAAGSTVLTVDAQYDDTTTPKVCGTANVIVGGTTALVCKPGAKCVSSTGVFKSGSNVTCSMPTLTSTELGGGTASYQLECTPYKATTAQTKIAKTSSNGTFGAFGIASGTTRYDCSFRYCLTKSGTTTCSVWGKL